ALGRLRHTLLVGDEELRVLGVEIRGYLVAHEIDAELGLEGDLGGRREPAFQALRQRVAHLDVLPEAPRGPLLRRVLRHEPLDVGGGPAREPDVAVLLRLGGLVALDADPGVVAQSDALAGLVRVDRLVRLVDRATAAELALSLLDG